MSGWRISKAGWYRKREFPRFFGSTHPFKLEGRERTLNPCMNANVEGPFEIERIPIIEISNPDEICFYIRLYIVRIGWGQYAAGAVKLWWGGIWAHAAVRAYYLLYIHWNEKRLYLSRRLYSTYIGAGACMTHYISIWGIEPGFAYT